MSGKTTYVVSTGCTYCNTCVFECPVGAIEMRESGAYIDPDSCIGCGRCRDNCASEAIQVRTPGREELDEGMSRPNGIGATRGGA